MFHRSPRLRSDSLRSRKRIFPTFSLSLDHEFARRCEPSLALRWMRAMWIRFSSSRYSRSGGIEPPSRRHERRLMSGGARSRSARLRIIFAERPTHSGPPPLRDRKSSMSGERARKGRIPMRHLISRPPCVSSSRPGRVRTERFFLPLRTAIREAGRQTSPRVPPSLRLDFHRALCA